MEVIKQADIEMKKQIRKVGKYYSSIIIGNIGLFMFVGFFSLIFQKQGWFPNEKLYALSNLVYQVILPVCISFTGGFRLSGQTGGVISVLAVAGILYTDPVSVIPAAMLAAPLGGVSWKYTEKWIRKNVGASVQMLTKNLFVGILGGICAAGGYYFLAPGLVVLENAIQEVAEYLLMHRLSVILPMVIEPMKVFFLNNVVNYGILIPLGMEQIQNGGSSILFLLETNPGPGFGVLAALYLTRKKERENYGFAMAAELVGGIHEVYFPVVLSRIWLLIPLMISGTAGAFWFAFMNCGIQAPVSPGSMIPILLLCEKGKILILFFGIMLSAGISFVLSLLVLKIQKDGDKEGDKKEKEERKMSVHTIGFICDAGVGSSAMGAALFRRKLAVNHMIGIQVEAFASDQIPDELDLIVCQRDFRRMLPEKTKAMEIFEVDSLLDQTSFEQLIEIIRKRNG